MTSVTINGQTFSDDDDPDTGFGAGGHRARLIPLAKAIVAVAAEVATDTQTATAKSDQAGASAGAAAAGATTAAGAATRAEAAAAVAVALASGSATGRAPLRPTLLLDFANGRFVDPRMSFTRATAATRINEFGAVENVFAGVPRITWDAAQLYCLGLRIEQAATNLLTWSDEFDRSAWAKSRVTVTPNAIVAPDGTLTADRVVASGGTGEASIGIPHTGLTAGGAVATSTMAKAGELGVLQIRWFGGSSAISSKYANFDLISGAVAGNADVIRIKRHVDGWFRIFAAVEGIGTLTAGQDTSFNVCASLADARRPSVTTDGTSGLYLWRAQTEAGAVATTGIATAGSQVQRTGESCAMPVWPWLRQGEGTIVAEFLREFPVSTGAAPRVLTLHDGTASNRIAIVLSRSGTVSQISAVITAAGVDVSTAAATFTPDTAVRVALAWRAGYAALYVNGAEVWTGTASIPAGLTTLSLGTDSAGGNHLNGVLSVVAYMPACLAAANAIAETA